MKSSAVIGAVVVSAFLAVGVLVHLAATGAFKPEPVVEITPKGGSNGTLRVATDADYWPYSFIDKDGKASGREVEIAYSIANELGMNIELKAMKWSECLELAGTHAVDLVLTCAEYSTECESDDLTSSLPLSSDDYMVFGKKPLKSPRELHGKRLAQLNYGNVNPTLRAAGFGAEMKLYHSHREAFMAIERGEADYIVIRYTPAVGLLKEMGLKDIKAQCSAGRSFFCIGINRHVPGLVKKVNNAIMVMRVNGELDRISEKWLTTYVEPDSLAEVVMKHQRAFFVFLMIVGALVLALCFFAHTRSRMAFRLKESMALIDGLSREYHTVWIIDGQSHDLLLYRTTGRSTAPGTVEYGKAKPNYDGGITWYVKTFVDQEDQERVGAAVSWEAVVKNTPDVGIYSVTYKRHPEPGKTDYHQMCFAKAVAAGGKTDYVFAYRDVDALVRDQMAKETVRQRELEDALGRADAANHAKTEFLFNMSHDIRTPMNAMKGFTEMAKKAIEKAEEEEKEKIKRKSEKVKSDSGGEELVTSTFLPFTFVRDCLDKIDRSGQLLLSLINSVLDMSRVEAGKAKVEEIAGDVRLSFAAIEIPMQELAKEKGISLSFEFGEVADRYVYADFDRCNRVFVNLISNAIKYSKPNGWVKARCEQIGDVEKLRSCDVEKLGEDSKPLNPSTSQPLNARVVRYRYTFADNGIGMSEEFQKHVFEEFAREHNSTTSGVQGTGLGMSLCKSFVELMGGTIKCWSKQGEGTTFTVELPFKVISKSEEVKSDQDTLNPSNPSNLSNPFIGKRVLLVEDNELNREVATYVLQEQGFEVDVAENGKIAVEKVKSKSEKVKSDWGVQEGKNEKEESDGSSALIPSSLLLFPSYDFILMDIQMPVMDGYEATRAIREWEASEKEKVKSKSEKVGDRESSSLLPSSFLLFPSHHIPIIALSANAFAEDKAASIAAGMDDHVAKPIKIKELMAAISKFKVEG